jgi:uncharacterized protein (DUF305 family)
MQVDGPEIKIAKRCQMSNLKTAIVFVVGLALGGGGAMAFQNQSMEMVGTKKVDPMAGMDHSQMNMGTEAAPAASTSNDAYKTAMDTMMSAMMVPYTGDADVDFAKGMIPHHNGAIDMAKVVLKYGKDTEIRKLAEAVVAAQESEIAFMQNWLKANGK